MNVSDRGLLGLAVDPGWPGRPYVYVLYTRDADIGGSSPKYGTAGTDADTCPNADHAGCVVSGRLVRVRLDPATDQAVGSPTGSIDGWCQQFSSHSIGDLRFGADGMLYASAGEGASFNYADYGQTGNPVRRSRSTRAARCARRTSGPRATRSATAAPSSASAPMAARPRSSPTDCATRSASPCAPARTSCGWATWAGGRGRSSIGSPRPARVSGELRVALLRGRRGPERVRRPQQAAVRDPVRAGRRGVGARRTGRTTTAAASTSALRPHSCRVGRRLRLHGRRLPCRLPGRRSSSRTTRATASGTCRAAPDGLPTRRRSARSTTAGCTRSSSSRRPTGTCSTPTSTTGSIVRVTYGRPTAAATAAPTSGVAPLAVQLDGTASTGTRGRVRLGPRRRRPVRRRDGRAPSRTASRPGPTRCVCG